MNSTVKQLLIVVFVAAGVLILWKFLGTNMGATHETTPSFSEVLAKAEDGKVKDVGQDGNTFVGHYTNGDQFRTTVPTNYPKADTCVRRSPRRSSSKNRGFPTRSCAPPSSPSSPTRSQRR